MQSPIELSNEDLKTLCHYLSHGLPRRLAANGIAWTEDDLQAWLDESPRREAILGAAEANFQLRCIEAILSPGKGTNVRAIMWLLEARFPDQYGKKKTSNPAKQTHQNPPAETCAPAQAAEPANVIDVPEQPFRNPQSAIRNNPTPGRNDACPCSSGFKYKHCCGATNPRARRTGVQTIPAAPELRAA